MLLNLVTNLFQYWISADWYIALAMSFCVNCAVYFVAAFLISYISSFIGSGSVIGQYLDTKPLKSNQVRNEILYGVGACFIFSCTSLLTRVVFKNIWPLTLADFLIQLIAFSVFYETYSYFIHRLLHLKILRVAHAVHHHSVRVTPWSAYSVHPIEAFLIGASAPIFMVIFPISLSVILGLHVVGMVFTMLIHSNIRFNSSLLVLRSLNRYTVGHALHHQKGVVNFGFTSSFWDLVFKTKSSSM